MSELILPRRRFLQGLATLFVAPAIIKASSLMPVKAWQERVWLWPVPEDATNLTLFNDRIFWLHPSNQMGMFYSDVGDWLKHPRAALITQTPAEATGPRFIAIA